MLSRSLVAISLTATALLAGCGDDEPKSAAPASTPAQAAAPTTTPTDATPALSEADEAKAKAKVKAKAKKSKDRPAWVNEVNARCKEYQQENTEKLAELAKTASTSPDAAANAMDAVVPIGRALVKDLREVDVPSDVSEDFTTFLDTIDGAFDLMPELTKSLSSGKQDPELMKQLANIEKNTRPFADEYGLEECLNGGGA